MNLPFAIVDTTNGQIPMLLGEAEGELVGFDMDAVWSFDPEDIIAVVNTDPAAVFYGVRAAWAVDVEERMVANRVRKRLPKFAAKGQAFPLLPEGVLSGFPVAARTIRKHREEVPSIDTIIVSSIFAVSTVRVRIEAAEVAYGCFGKLYRERARTMPTVGELKNCFQGLQNTKSAMFADVAAFAPTIRQVIEMGYLDRELRSVLALDSVLPSGLGLAKLSFTLALLGHDTICLDGRLLGTMFTAKDRADFERATRKEEGGAVSVRALRTYEAAEDAFLEGNRHFDPRDPIGRARAQWTAWEAVGGKGAEHRPWLSLLEEDM